MRLASFEGTCLGEMSVKWRKGGHSCDEVSLPPASRFAKANDSATLGWQGKQKSQPRRKLSHLPGRIIEILLSSGGLGVVFSFRSLDSVRII
jgi:hypothetical protein